METADDALYLLTILTAGDSAGSGGGGGGGGSSSTCDESMTHTVEWTFTGNYEVDSTKDDVSVFVGWGKSGGSYSQTYSEAENNLSQPTLHTESNLPGCSSATINVTLLDSVDGSDGNKVVELGNVEIAVKVDGTKVASETFSDIYSSGTLLPSGGALTAIVGE